MSLFELGFSNHTSYEKEKIKAAVENISLWYVKIQMYL